jgi:uncharacterized RDD family membrane protein YckC
VVWPQDHCDSFSQFGLKTGDDGFFRFHLKTCGDGFPGLGLKISSYGLVIWASKSLRWFLGLGLKTNRATVCRLRYKTAMLSNGLLRIRASQAIVSQSVLKTGGGTTVSGACGTIVEVTWSSSGLMR